MFADDYSAVPEDKLYNVKNVAKDNAPRPDLCCGSHTPPNKLNEVYSERNKLVAALARILCQDRALLGLRVGVAEHDATDENWDPDWRTLLVIDDPLGVGSMTWHFPLWDRWLLDGLPVMHRYEYDGHTTAEKYRRLHSYATEHGTDENAGYSHSPETSPFTPTVCRFCGSKHALYSTNENRDFIVARCPMCSAQGPRATTPREALIGWNKIMGGT